MNPEKEKAQAKSYAGQSNHALLAPNGELILGFQPVSIASQIINKDTTMVAVAAYFEPAILLVEVSPDTGGYYHFTTSWIRGCDYQGRRIRLFPDFVDGEPNRAQTVNFGPNGELWVTRNGGREFFILEKPATPSGRWILREKLTLPGTGMVHSATVTEMPAIGMVGVTTIESDMACENWSTAGYLMGSNGQFHTQGSDGPLPPFTYGNAGYLITDPRSKEPKGISPIFDRGTLVVRNITGNGIALLHDGSALVTSYGQAHPGPFNGEPGKIKHVDAKFVSGK